MSRHVHMTLSVGSSGAASPDLPFNKMNLHQLQTNPLYVGKVKYKTELHRGEHQPLIAEELSPKAIDAIATTFARTQRSQVGETAHRRPAHFGRGANLSEH